jgi:hypothetical protein
MDVVKYSFGLFSADSAILARFHRATLEHYHFDPDALGRRHRTYCPWMVRQADERGIASVMYRK